MEGYAAVIGAASAAAAEIGSQFICKAAAVLLTAGKQEQDLFV